MKPSVQKQIKKALAKNTSCYVLITCEEPTPDGNMQVEMSYEGDATVASYLLEGAQTFMHEQEEIQGIHPPATQEKKILPINSAKNHAI